VIVQGRCQPVLPHSTHLYLAMKAGICTHREREGREMMGQVEGGCASAHKALPQHLACVVPCGPSMQTFAR